jgi:phosphatidylserine decarboxylase
MNNNIFLVFFFRILPKSLFSRFFGYITRIPLPGFFINPVIKIYSGFFNVKKDEILVPEKGFRTFDQFFTRQLKPGARIIDPEINTIISPVDARIDQFGMINRNKLIQAKGIEYTINDLIPSAASEKFVNGSYITLYLSPADYHRIHSPLSGKIYGSYHIPGKLFPVQEFITANVKKLFSVNERIITYIHSNTGSVAVCMVGAMNVGRISLSYSDAVSNKFIRSRKEIFYTDDKQPDLNKGDELGTFHLGSTVIILFQKDMIRFADIGTGQKVKVGQVIASLID